MTIRVITTALVVLLTCVSVSPVAVGQSVHSTIERVQQRIVKVFGAGGIRRLHSYSTGFVVSPAGHVATVWSHVLDTEELTVVLADGRKVTAKVMGAEPQLDLPAEERPLQRQRVRDVLPAPRQRPRRRDPGHRVHAVELAGEIAGGAVLRGEVLRRVQQPGVAVHLRHARQRAAHGDGFGNGPGY